MFKIRVVNIQRGGSGVVVVGDDDDDDDDDDDEGQPVSGSQPCSMQRMVNSS